jgi:predicted 3-demethylubiquinone-9 3-methyltransferase (glyoxalase superfamily)
MSHKIVPFIRCVNNAKDLAQFYVDVFGADAKITKENPVVIGFEIFWQSMSALNGWPHDSVNPSISFSLWITDKDRTKEIRDKLSEGWNVLMPFDAYSRSPAYGRCNDKFGVSRQVMYDNAEGHTENKVIPSLMFTGANAGKAEEAMNLYSSIFPASKVGNIHRYQEGEPDVPGYVAHGEFTLVNQLFIAMDSSAPHGFTFNDGISLAVSCKDQEEVNYYWNKLALDGGQESQCGRCKDKYGVARQIFPLQLPEALFNSDPTKAQYAMQQMMKMKKIVIDDLYMK